MNELKKFKKLPYFIISPVVSVIGEIVFIFALFAAMENMFFGHRNMANFLMSLVIGAALWGIYGLIELLFRKKYEMEWYTFSVGAYLIPVIFWSIASLISYTSWYSHRLDEDAEFFMYFTRTMLVYIFIAGALRVVGHLIFIFLGRERKKK